MPAYPMPPLPSDDKRWKIVNGTMRRNGYTRNALIEELKAILLDSYYGRPFVELHARHVALEDELAVAAR